MIVSGGERFVPEAVNAEAREQLNRIEAKLDRLAPLAELLEQVGAMGEADGERPSIFKVLAALRGGS